jgi:hypothetical protein
MHVRYPIEKSGAKTDFGGHVPGLTRTLDRFREDNSERILDTTLYNPCPVRVAAPRRPVLGEQSNESSQDVVPDGRSDLRIHSACRAGGSYTVGRRADTGMHRTWVPLRYLV